jgi:hypothetical protein
MDLDIWLFRLKLYVEGLDVYEENRLHEPQFSNDKAESNLLVTKIYGRESVMKAKHFLNLRKQNIAFHLIRNHLTQRTSEVNKLLILHVRFGYFAILKGVHRFQNFTIHFLLHHQFWKY